MQLRSALSAATVLATPIAARAHGHRPLCRRRCEHYAEHPGQPQHDIWSGDGQPEVGGRVCRCGEHGVGLRQHLRAELEGYYRNNPFNSGSGCLVA